MVSLGLLSAIRKQDLIVEVCNIRSRFPSSRLASAYPLRYLNFCVSDVSGAYSGVAQGPSIIELQDSCRTYLNSSDFPKSHAKYEISHRTRIRRLATLVGVSGERCWVSTKQSMSSSGATEEEMEIPEGYAEIVVVRHGETSWNASRILQGHLDPELNEIGRQQAVAVANRLSKEPKFNAIYSSDLKRAAETAQIIASQCNLKEVILDQQLRERNLGDLQGSTLVDAQKMKPNVYKDFLSHKRDQEIPGGGESLDQLHQRCVSSFRKLACQHKGERVVVVSHGGFMRELHRKAAPNRKLEGKIQNTSVNVVLISASKNHWFIKKWGDTSHLQGIGALDSGFGGDKTSG